MYDRFHLFFFVIISVVSVFFFSQKIVFSVASTAATINVTAVVLGGGGSPEPITPTEVIFSGKAYQNSMVSLLKDVQFVEKKSADSDSDFEISLLGLTGGTYLFSFYAEDLYGTRSGLVTMSVNVMDNVKTTVSNILLPPTINLDKSSVKQGEKIIIFGQTTTGVSDVIIEYGLASTSSSSVITVSANSSGLYEYVLDTTPLPLGGYEIKVKTGSGGSGDSYSRTTFLIGEKEKPTFLMADLNDDKKVDIVDFSIAAFWYKRPFDGVFTGTEKERLNGDGKINLIDFSMIAYYWTGE